MGYENLFGQGRGQAQVFDSSGIVNTYARQLQLKGLQRQKEQEAYAKELENISWDGAREADEPHFRKKWEAILDLNHKRSITDKKEDRILYSSQIQTLKKEMVSDAKRSVNENKTDRDIASMPLSKNQYEMPDKFGEILTARKSTSTFDPLFNNFGADKFQIQAKPYDVNKNLMEIAGIAAKEVNTKSIVGEGLDARYVYNEGKQLDKGAFVTAFLDNIASDPQAKDTYLKGLEPTPENLNDAAEAAYGIMENKFALKERKGDRVDEEGYQLDLYEKKRQIGTKYDAKPAENSEDKRIYRQNLIGRLFDGDKEAFEEVKAYLPSGSGFELVTSKEVKGKSKGGYSFIRLNIPEGMVNGIPVQAIKEDISFSKGDPMNRLNSIIGQYTDEKISASKLNTVGGKPRGDQYKVTPTNTGQSPQPAKRTISKSDLAGKAKSSGYTVAEYEKLLKAKGVTIK